MSETNTPTPTESRQTTSGSSSQNPNGLRICCACPETRKVRDECIVTKGEEYCPSEIEAHKRCLRELGFKI